MAIPDSTTEVRKVTTLGQLLEPIPDPIMSGSRIQGAPSPWFMLRHHPSNWEAADVDGVVRWLPEIGIHPAIPGVLGGRTLTKVESGERWKTVKAAVLKAQDKGWIYLDPDEAIAAEHLPDGVPVGPYIRRVPCRSASGESGWMHVEAWNVPIPGVKGEPQPFRFDRTSYNKWRAHLVDTGRIPAPLVQYLDRKVAVLATHMSRAQAANVNEDVRQRRIKATSDRLKAAKAAEAGGTDAPQIAADSNPIKRQQDEMQAKRKTAAKAAKKGGA